MAAPKTQNLGLNKIDRATPTLSYFDLKTYLEDNWDRLDQVVTPKTTDDLTFYVATTGNDANDGLTAGTALRTIGTAIAKIPQIVNHTITINIAPGTYAEDVVINGFSGKALIYLIGDTSNPANVAIKSASFHQCTCYVSLEWVTITGFAPSNYSLIVDRCLRVAFAHIINTFADSSRDGVASLSSSIYVGSCELSNKRAAISTRASGRIYSDNNSGNGNNYGLLASECGVIAKNGTQPAGTTAEIIESGGVIR